MKPEVRFDLNSADPQTFTGPAFMRLIASAEESQRIKLYYVRFEVGGRTFWHSHQGRQILIVTSGRCRYQRDGEPIMEIGAGESVTFEEGVRHWHGAAEDEAAEHIAVNLDIKETDWFEEVSLG